LNSSTPILFPIKGRAVYIHSLVIVRTFFLSETEYELEKTEKVLQETLNEKAMEANKFQEQASLVFNCLTKNAMSAQVKVLLIIELHRFLLKPKYLIRQEKKLKD
jgi:hypothetical protein